MKLIDWEKVPRGTMTQKGELIHVHLSFASVLQYDEEGRPTVISVMPTKWLRIVPATRWTHHENGDECPLPDGMLVEYKAFDVHDGIVYGNSRHVPCYAFVYRITGVGRSGGWTDDPSEVTD